MAGRAVPGLRIALQSAILTSRLRARGARGALVTYEGRRPVLTLDGTLALGRLSLRAVVAPVELGAAAGARLEIGERVFINQGASVVAHRSITIGDDARIGDFAAIYDSDHHQVEEGSPVRTAAVSIGRNAWIGRSAVVLPGVTVGEHSVVAAGAVVTRSVPPRTLVGGNPARPLRELAAADGWRRG